jgi:hypothetical protein
LRNTLKGFIRKGFIGTAAALLPAVLLAQTYGGFDRKDLEPLIGKAQACMAQADQNQLQALQSDALLVMTETQAMCNVGERDAAQQNTIEFAQQSLQKLVVKEWQQCMGLLGQTLPLLALVQMQNPEATGSHVCDLPARVEELPR